VSVATCFLNFQFLYLLLSKYCAKIFFVSTLMWRFHMQTTKDTPWGRADYKKVIADGITFYGTPSHGGFHLTPERQAAMPDALRLSDPWYEEDCDWVRIVCAFPEAFEAETREKAEAILKNWRPDAYEAWSGKTLAPGMSCIRDVTLFYEAHKNDFLFLYRCFLPWSPTVCKAEVSVGGVKPGPTGKICGIPYLPEGQIEKKMILYPSEHPPIVKDHGTPGGAADIFDPNIFHVETTLQELERLADQFYWFKQDYPEQLIAVGSADLPDDPEHVAITCRPAGFLRANNREDIAHFIRLKNELSCHIIPRAEWEARDIRKIPVVLDGRLVEIVGQRPDSIDVPVKYALLGHAEDTYAPSP
jgi:hypothetical protein